MKIPIHHVDPGPAIAALAEAEAAVRRVLALSGVHAASNGVERLATLAREMLDRIEGVKI